MGTSNAEIRVAQENDIEELERLVHREFYPEEPTVKYLHKIHPDLFDNDEKPKGSKPEDFLNPTLVYTKENKIIGFAVNKVLGKGNENILYGEVVNLHEDVEPKFLPLATNYMAFMNFVENNAKITEFFPECKKGLLLDKLYVNPKYRGEGIGKKLCEETINIAKRIGCNYVKVVASSYFTIRLVEKLDFELVYSIKYADYKIDGVPFLHPEYPHDSLSVYIKKL